MTKSIVFYTFLLLGILSLVSCASSERLLDSGDYDGVIDLAIRKLRGKTKKKQEYVTALEEAFRKATTQDLRQADQLVALGDPAAWEAVYGIYTDMRRRQERIQPLLPLVSKEGYQADFKFVRLDNLQQTAANNAAAHLYQLAQDLLIRAENGDRVAARQAYDYLNRSTAYSKIGFADRPALIDKARELGTTNVLIEVDNKTATIMPFGFERDLLEFNTFDMNDTWKNYYTSSSRDMNFDYIVRLDIRNVRVSPERIQERTFTESKQIQDGEEYVLDNNGNVAKDSLGNDIKVPKQVTISADITEVLQTKQAEVIGELVFYDRQQGKRVYSERITAEAIFEHYASTFLGDERALSREARQYIGNRPAPFPTDEAMILQTTEELKNLMKDKIERNRIIL